MGTFFAGMDTVSVTCSFMLYAILKAPGLLAQVQKHLLALQGRDHLWLAGLYMHDID